MAQYVEKNRRVNRARKLGTIMTRIGVFIAQDTSFGPDEEKARKFLMDAINRVEQAQHILAAADALPSDTRQLSFLSASAAAPVES